MNVGFIGLGIMGQPMARNALSAGFAVAVYDRMESRCDALRAAGAVVLHSAAEVSASADVVITMVPDTAAVEDVLFSAGGVAEGIRPGAVVIDMSTISPQATEQFAARLREKSVEMLDAPVSGGEPGAIAGTLSIMVGGARPVLDRFLPLLQSMGKRIVYCGGNGAGQKTKVVNQIVGSLNLLATIEGLRVAKAAGLDLPEVVQAVAGGAAGSWMLSNLGPKIIAGDFNPGFSIRLHAKDLRLANEFTQQLGLDTPGTSLAHRLFEEAMKQGLENLGNQGLYKLWSD
ncbi:MAG: NAD(P)-dependent oxidoreductase [Bryobacterales bacterium]|nr:NAD(P)-dependent oxidoreductase [Bryobacterales bacterium]